MLQQLKTLDLDRIDIEDAVAAQTFGKALMENFKANKLPVPEWLQEKMPMLDRAIAESRRDLLTRERKHLQGQRDGLRSADERRKDLDSRLAEIDASLNS